MWLTVSSACLHIQLKGDVFFYLHSLVVSLESLLLCYCYKIFCLKGTPLYIQLSSCLISFIGLSNLPCITFSDHASYVWFKYILLVRTKVLGVAKLSRKPSYLSFIAALVSPEADSLSLSLLSLALALALCCCYYIIGSIIIVLLFLSANHKLSVQPWTEGNIDLSIDWIA